MIKREVMEIVNEYLGIALNKGAGFVAHPIFWNVFENEKSKKLKDLFGDKLIIEKEVEIQKTAVDIRKELENAGLSGKIRRALDPCWMDYVRNYFPYDYHGGKDSEANILHSSSRNLLDLTSDYCLAEPNVSYTREIKHPETGKMIKIQGGSKIMKSMKFFISDKTVLEGLQTEYSQIMNTKTIKGTLCLSIHPLDYLTASVNQNGWTSCYNTIEKGEWCASTLSLISSPNTMIAYLKSTHDMNVGGLKWNNKRWRSYVTLNEDNELVHIGRNYPYCNEELMDKVVSIVGELTNKSYGDLADSEGRVSVYTPENMYNDASEGDIYTYITKDWAESSEDIEISPIGAICPVCGTEYDDCEFDIVCGDCSDGNRCIDCDRCLGEGGHWVESREGYVCECCYDNNYSSCEHCDESYHSEDVHRVGNAFREDGGRSTWYGATPHYWFEYWCESCIEQEVEAGTVVKCSDCGEYVKYEVSNEEEEFVCRDCKERKGE